MHVGAKLGERFFWLKTARSCAVGQDEYKIQEEAVLSTVYSLQSHIKVHIQVKHTFPNHLYRNMHSLTILSYSIPFLLQFLTSQAYPTATASPLPLDQTLQTESDDPRFEKAIPCCAIGSDEWNDYKNDGAQNNCYQAQESFGLGMC
jgi:hypothetical protein